jgi:hypothetical protein
MAVGSKVRNCSPLKLVLFMPNCSHTASISTRKVVQQSPGPWARIGSRRRHLPPLGRRFAFTRCWSGLDLNPRDPSISLPVIMVSIVQPMKTRLSEKTSNLSHGHAFR